MNEQVTLRRLLVVFTCLLCASGCFTGPDSDEAFMEAASTTGQDGSDAAPVTAEEAFPGVAGTPATMYVDTLDDVIEVTYLHLENGYGVVDGDIILYGPNDAGMSGPDADVAVGHEDLAHRTGLINPDTTTIGQPPQHGAVINRLGRRWHNREILWAYDPVDTPPIGGHVRAAFEQALVDIAAVVDVTFIPYNFWLHGVHADRIVVRQPPPNSPQGCSSYIGRVGGPQAITLSAGCAPYGAPGIAIHEISHAIGLWHEQSRDDRNMHVVVDTDNSMGGYEHNFFTQDSDRISDYNVASIMHYSSCSFSKCTDPNVPMSTRCFDHETPARECGWQNRAEPRCSHCTCTDANGTCQFPTIVASDGARIAGQRVALQQSDIDALDYALGCPGGLDGDYCGGPIGLDADILYSCNNGYYSVQQDCGDGTCMDDSCAAP